jgi:peptidoglycan/LPS O-acetylase OafA/YrhL
MRSPSSVAEEHVAHDAGRSRPTNPSLDVVRGAAALLVVLSHVRLYPLQAVGRTVSSESRIDRVLLAPTSFGKEYVAVFFVLSGALVGGQALRQIQSGRFSWANYLTKRLTRLWIVLLPGIAVTAALDALAGRYFPGGLSAAKLGQNGASRLDGSIGAAACNAGFLQMSRCTTFGSNASLWSLSYEFWFYILFAAATMGVFAVLRRRWTTAVLGTVVAVGCVVIFGADLLKLIPAWLIGVGVAVLVDQRRWTQWTIRKWALPTVCVLLVASLAASNVLGLSDPWKFLLIGLGAAPFVLFLSVRNPRPRIARPAFDGMAWLGAWSFSLYVFHVPLVGLAAAATSKHPHVLEGNLGVVVIYGLALTVLIATWPLSLVTERQTSRARVAIENLTTRHASDPRSSKLRERNVTSQSPQVTATDGP